jgi:hypothetical protein
VPDITFQKCVCGFHLKIMRLLDQRRQILVCECGRENKVDGTILGAHYAKTPQDPLWIKLPLWNIRDEKY